ncbi:Hypothetical protein SRAE_2000503800 [Strongyloides ratti]|uniref:Uncharacterized protein n=1 Tax=Strongyloides ratti TaxID=34506 RepID=A0A090LL13_STRRB|nr:Hypothetical protein SRAE_2000503800 [Strongyloides ratti]CEF70405.1 Hypothetical protein SRAE_2000503800 [Strongyloides ratti]
MAKHVELTARSIECKAKLDFNKMTSTKTNFIKFLTCVIDILFNANKFGHIQKYSTIFKPNQALFIKSIILKLNSKERIFYK